MKERPPWREHRVQRRAMTLAWKHMCPLGRKAWREHSAQTQRIRKKGTRTRFIHGVCYVLGYCETAGQTNRTQLGCPSNSSTSLSTAQSHWLYHKAPSASSTTAFLIGIKCDSNQLLSYGCHFLTAYLHLPRQPCASSFPCPAKHSCPVLVPATALSKLSKLGQGAKPKK